MLKLREITKTYAGGHPVHALRNTSFVIADGELVTISGPSGSGKSTLLNILGLLDLATTGTYLIDGIDAAAVSESTRGAIRGQLFGFVFQAFHLLAGRSVLENVELGMVYGPMRGARRSRLAADTLERVGMSHRLNADPRTLSGGERQRVAIARAVAPAPRFLFCDEPTGNLDSTNTTNIVGLLEGLNRDGLTVVVVTHDREIAASGRRRLDVIDGVVLDHPAAGGTYAG
jgi:putative ABC transport system ATP-binding protein